MRLDGADRNTCDHCGASTGKWCRLPSQDLITSPRARFLMLMHERKRDDLVLFDHAEEGIQEAAQHCPADLAFDSPVKRELSSQKRLCAFEILDECSRLLDLRLRAPGIATSISAAPVRL